MLFFYPHPGQHLHHSLEYHFAFYDYHAGLDKGKKNKVKCPERVHSQDGVTVSSIEKGLKNIE